MFTPTAKPEVHIAEWQYPAEYDDGDLGHGPMSDETRAAIRLIQPMIDDETVSIAQAAEQAHVPSGRVTRALTQVRAVARQQGLRPSDEERQALDPFGH